MNAFPLLSDDPGTWFAVDVAAKGTLLIVLGAGLVLLLNRSSAALRHRVWALVFVALLLLPAVGLAVPGWHWHVIPRTGQLVTPTVQQAAPIAIPASSRPDELGSAKHTAAASEASGAPIVQETRGAGSSLSAKGGDERPGDEPTGDEQVADNSGRHAGRQQTDRISHVMAARLSGAWLLLAWLGGALLAAVPLAIGILANTRTRRRCLRLTEPDWQALLARLSGRLGLRREVMLLVADPEQMPMTFGRWRPCVVLPADARDWSPARRQVVLLHELAHVTRNDVPLQMIGRLACAVYWFHPLAWWALRRMRVEREYACDDHVLRTGQKASDYAADLLEIARAHGRRSVLLNAALSMARPSQLEGRLLAVLDANRRRTPLGTTWTGGLAALTLALVMGLAAVRPTLEARPPAPGENAASNAASVAAADRSNQFFVTGVVLSPDGRPVPAARVEVVTYDRTFAWDWGSQPNGPKEYEHHETQSDIHGAFRVALARNVTRPDVTINILASAANYSPAAHVIYRRTGADHCELRLHNSKRVQVRLFDAAGAPINGVSTVFEGAFIDGDDGFWFTATTLHKSPAWPQPARSDKDGYVTFTVPASTKEIELKVDDEKFGSPSLRLKTGDKVIGAVLKKARFLNGKVTAAEDGSPIGGAEVLLVQEPRRRARTNPDGTFHVASGKTINTLFRQGETIIQVYPPTASDYLFQAIEWKWPDDGLSNGELSVALKRGIVIEGQVLEKDSGKPVAGAKLQFEPQQGHNPYFRETSRSRFSGADMRYPTDAQGRFRMPVWPGPGYLLVNAPTFDYVHVETSLGDKHYGKTGLQREYYDAVLKLNLHPGDHSQPLAIQLQRGVTLRRKVVCPDGRPAVGKAFARSYLEFGNDINQWLPELVIDDGLLELPGFEPKSSNPLFIIDREHHCGATISVSANAVAVTDPPIQLQPCGSAKFHFLNEQGKPFARYEPFLLVIVTPGAPATHHIEPNRPLWVEGMYWQNITRPAQVPKTDTDGRVTVGDLIPGATYRLSFVNKKGSWDDGYEFAVRPGKTTDVGPVILPQHD